MTEYFFWPRKDAWEELKASLDARTWIGEREKVLLLNQCTEVINFWQADTRPSLEEARAKFPNSKFQVRQHAGACCSALGGQQRKWHSRRSGAWRRCPCRRS